MKRERRTYCRLCYARIPNYRGASVPCPACGEAHLRAHEEKHWTLEPRLVKLEKQAKGASIVLAVGLGWWTGHRKVLWGFAAITVAVAAWLVPALSAWTVSTPRWEWLALVAGTGVGWALARTRPDSPVGPNQPS